MMKKLVLIAILIAVLSVGCNKEIIKEDKISVYCNDCGNESNKVTMYCNDCGVDAKWVLDKTITQDDEYQDVKEMEIEYLKGYIEGYKYGYSDAQTDSPGGDAIIKTEYDKGYADGVNDGWDQCIKDGNDYKTKTKSTDFDEGILNIYGVAYLSEDAPGDAKIIERDAFRFDQDEDIIKVLSKLCKYLEETYEGIIASVDDDSDIEEAIVNVDITGYEATYTHSGHVKIFVCETLEQIEGEEEGKIDEIIINFISNFDY